MANIRQVRFVAIAGVFIVVSALTIRSHILSIRAAKLEHAVAPAPYFPAGAIWTKDISKEPADPQSSTIISWLSNAGGWGGGRMQDDWSTRVLQATKDTPAVPFRKGKTFYSPDSDTIKTFPLPVGGGIEGGSGY